MLAALTVEDAQQEAKRKRDAYESMQAEPAASTSGRGTQAHTLFVNCCSLAALLFCFQKLDPACTQLHDLNNVTFSNGMYIEGLVPSHMRRYGLIPAVCAYIVAGKVLQSYWLHCSCFK